MKLLPELFKPRHFISNFLLPTPAALRGALAFLLLCLSNVARANELILPTPPQQYTPWKAPSTKLPAAVVSATQELFLLGLADPRGCNYREITITTGDVWGRVREVQTHGWVLPQGQFAIAWNGLVYPLTASGPPVDLREDLARLSTFEIRQALPEAQAVGVPPRSLIGVCLLLRLGESAGAENLWRMARRSPLAKPDIKRAPPLEELASHWTWALWDRALCAHLRSDDRLALHDARQLKQLQPLVESKVRAARSKAKNRTPFHLMFLAPLSRFLKDQERRAKGIRVLPKDNIVGLIENLENVSARQWGQPGGVDLTTAPVVQELIAQGRRALPALLNVMEKDGRLTRSVSFHREYFTHRQLIGTGEAAYAAFRKITGQSFGPISDIAAGGNKRLTLVKRARSRWSPRPTLQNTKLNFADVAHRLRQTATQNSQISAQSTNFNLLFEPLWRYPTQPALARLGDELFNGTNRLWNPLIDPRRPAGLEQVDVIAGPLLVVPAYRAQVLRQLKNWTKCGTVEVRAGQMRLQTSGGTGGTNLHNADASTNSRSEFRVCDFYAWHLSQINGAPRCELYWPFEQRDRAVAEMALWLQAYGARLKPAPQAPQRPAAVEWPRAEIAFPSIRRPASPEDVQSHRAVFSLQGLGKTRLVNMMLPVEGRWKNQSVRIWQAEEVAVGKEWRRYYGIVARHQIRRVPASEVELLKAK